MLLLLSLEIVQTENSDSVDHIKQQRMSDVFKHLNHDEN